MNFIALVLRGFSQVFFLDNIVLGVLIAIGLLIASPIGFFLALIGNITSVTFNTIFYSSKNISETHLYGLNGVLVGAAVSFYIKNLPLGIGVTIVASIIAALIFHLLLRNHIPPLAAPFIVVIWLTLVIIRLAK